MDVIEEEEEEIIIIEEPRGGRQESFKVEVGEKKFQILYWIPLPVWGSNPH